MADKNFDQVAEAINQMFLNRSQSASFDQYYGKRDVNEPKLRDPAALAQEEQDKWNEVQRAMPEWLQKMGAAQEMLPAFAGSPSIPSATKQGMAVKRGQLVGPKRLQEWLNMFQRTPDSERSASEGGWRIGSGAQGDVFRVPDTDTTFKIARGGGDYQDQIVEAMRLHALKDNPNTGVKQFLGTLSKPVEDLKDPGPYSEMMDHIAKGRVDPRQVEGDPVLFTRMVPGKDVGIPTRGTIPIDIDALRATLNEMDKKGIFVRDLNRGNYKLQPGGKLNIVDLGVGGDKFSDSLAGYNANRPEHLGIQPMLNRLLPGLANRHPTNLSLTGDKNDPLKYSIASKFAGSDDPKVIDRWLQNFRKQNTARDAEFYPSKINPSDLTRGDPRRPLGDIQDNIKDLLVKWFGTSDSGHK